MDVIIPSTPSREPSRQPTYTKFLTDPPVDAAAGIQGREALESVLPSTRQLARSLGGVWEFDEVLYFAPGTVKKERANAERQAPFVVYPDRCTDVARALLFAVLFTPPEEEVWQGIRQGNPGEDNTGELRASRYASVQAAAAELSGWVPALERCKRFTLTGTATPVRATVREVRQLDDRVLVRVTFPGAGAEPVRAETALARAGSMVLLASSLWTPYSKGTSPVTAAKLSKLVDLMNSNVAEAAATASPAAGTV